MQLFQIARFNVICAARTPGTAEAIPNAYAYAWQVGVFPLFHETAGLHLPFAEEFDVPPDMVTELSKFLDDSWLKKEVPSFYKLEDYYKVRSGGGFWDRMRLIHSCRYMFLKGMFDQEFWEVIKFRQPSEADSITSKFRTDEIYLE